ncbi:hypothetical protein KKC91_06850 [bacterium]|nr:hypothetical protein [bacterium]
MKKKKQKTSVSEKIMKIVNKNPKTAEGIKKELKDKFGCTAKLADVRVNLLYLLRRDKIQRKKDGAGGYKYFI